MVEYDIVIWSLSKNWKLKLHHCILNFQGMFILVFFLPCRYTFLVFLHFSFHHKAALQSQYMLKALAYLGSKRGIFAFLDFPPIPQIPNFRAKGSKVSLLTNLIHRKRRRIYLSSAINNNLSNSIITNLIHRRRSQSYLSFAINNN